MTIVREQKKTSEIFCYVVQNNFSYSQKKFLIKFGNRLFENSRSWKKSQGQTTKKYYFHFLVTDLESLVNFH